MANKLKASKIKPPDPDQLKQEKEETVEVKQLLKDERTHKIAGSILLLLAFLFFIAFTSYLFTWGEDQDKFSYRMLLANDIKVQNLLGTFGALYQKYLYAMALALHPILSVPRSLFSALTCSLGKGFFR